MRFIPATLVGICLSCAAPKGLIAEDVLPVATAIEPCARFEERTASGCEPVEVISLVSESTTVTRGGYGLHGTSLRPVTRGNYRAPGVVLVHGSGPQDRDENIKGTLGFHWGQNVPVFRLLAEGLARQGIAVYRYDKRTCFKENSEGRCVNSAFDYPGGFDKIYTADFVLDARAALQHLAQQPGVDPDDLTIIGHSEGASFVPLILADEPGVIAGVQLSGTSESIDKTIVNQLRGYADHLERAGLTQQAAAVRAQASSYETNFAQLMNGSYPEPTYEGATSAQWREWFMHTSNLRNEFQSATKPIFVINGDADFNVPTSHLERFRSWADEAMMTNAQFLVARNVTHVFVTTNDAQTAIVDFGFSAPVLSAIIEWHRALPGHVRN